MPEQTPRVRTLVTHSGAFHADDVLAHALLADLHPDAGLLRTREADAIAAAGPAIVFDVGERYDPAAGRYDHHQPDRPCRADGLPWSSFGQVWHHLGRAWLCILPGLELADAAALEALHARIDARLVRPIDMLDNGATGLDIPEAARTAELLGELALPSLLDLFRAPAGVSSAEEDRAFLAASGLARQILRQWALKAAEILAGEALLAQALAARTDPHWVELCARGSVTCAFLADSDPRLLYAVFPGRSEWQLAAVTVAPGS